MAHTDASVLLVGNFLSSQIGVRTVCEDLAERLARAGWRVLTTSAKQERVARVLDMVKTAWLRRTEYRIAQVDVYSGAAFVWAEAACMTLQLAHKPYVLTLHGGNLPAFAAQWRTRVRRLLRNAQAVTAPSPYLIEQMRPFRDDLMLVPNALDLSLYSFRHRTSAAPRLVWLRAFHDIYNPVLAVKVLSRIAERFPDATLDMFGPDKHDGSLEKTKAALHNLRIQHRVNIHGRVTKAEVGACIDRGDIFLNTARVDNAPVSVLEAMACGACVVSTRVGGIPYLLRNEYDALLTPSGDDEAMANAVQRLLTNSRLVSTLSGNARQTSGLYDWCEILNQWRSLLS
jgi:glycosyltransferase involved in cell wall biosynthesis